MARFQKLKDKFWSAGAPNYHLRNLSTNLDPSTFLMLPSWTTLQRDALLMTTLLQITDLPIKWIWIFCKWLLVVYNLDCKWFDRLKWSFLRKNLVIFCFWSAWIGLIRKLIFTSNWLMVFNRELYVASPRNMVSRQETQFLSIFHCAGRNLSHIIELASKADIKPIYRVHWKPCHLLFLEYNPLMALFFWPRLFAWVPNWCRSSLLMFMFHHIKMTMLIVTIYFY